jgi:hypothetical protein
MAALMADHYITIIRKIIVNIFFPEEWIAFSLFQILNFLFYIDCKRLYGRQIQFVFSFSLITMKKCIDDITSI